MYSSLREIWIGWRKNFYTVGGSRATTRSILRLLLIFDLFVLPYFVLAWGILSAIATALNAYLITGAFMSALLWLGIIVLDHSVGVGLGYALLLPLGVLVYIGIGIDSTIRGILGLGFTWKGRVYTHEAQPQLEAQIA